MKKILSAVVAVALVVISGCSKSSTESKNSTGGESSPSTQSSGMMANTSQGNNQLPDDEVVFTYDKTPYLNVSCDSYYNVEYLPLSVDEDAYIELYTKTPEVTRDEGWNIFFDAGDEWGMASPKTECMYRYHTVRGHEMDAIATDSYRAPVGSDASEGAEYNYEKFSTELELDFISREELKNELQRKLSKLIPDSELNMDIYAVTADEYKQMTEFYDMIDPDNVNNTDRWRLESGDTHTWSESVGFYFIYGTQKVGGMGIFARDTGDSRYSARRAGQEFLAVYTDKGLEYLYISGQQLKIGEAVPAGQDVISLAEAEQIVANKFYESLFGEAKVFSNVDFRYLPLEDKSGKMSLTPVWKFWSLSLIPDYGGTGFPDFGYGDIVYINAFTGEVIK